jgi:hypothetical protein
MRAVVPVSALAIAVALVSCATRPPVSNPPPQGEPAQALLALAKRDREEGASYRLTDIPKFEAGQYAEVEIARMKGGGEKRFVVPFMREEKKWRAGAAYRDGREWEEPEF